MMRALAVDPATQSSRIVDLPVPEAKPGQILVEVKVAGINEMDVEVRAGGWAAQVNRFRREGPVLTGFEFAGVARTSGTHIRAGQRVMGYSPVLNGPRVHAQFAAVPESGLLAISESLSDESAAALCVMGLTAVEVLERLCPLAPAQSCLVIGAAGGFGAYAVQLAASRGVNVTAVASAANESWVRAQGAHQFRPYEAGRAVSPGDAFDLLIDTPARLSFRAAAPFLSRSGMYVSSNPTSDLAGLARSRFSSRRAGFLMMLKTSPSRLARLVDLAGDGTLRAAIDSVFDIAEADKAFDRFATRGKQGRVLLRI
ncbi:putative oxidoreductase [Hyphomonas hirschiana VP5]|nr:MULTISPECIES: NAD(P)-dependent alcohol dehydrogenase [Hyphomonas]KCZ92603.1 putative oxidoreductase [Hyphomonas hirschiana VP5]